MSDNREPDNNGGNPWLKSLLVWGGIFLALLLVVSMFGGPRAAAGTEIRYSDFRQKVAEGSVDEVQISTDQISGKLKNGQTFSTVPVANDTSLPKLLDDSGVRLEDNKGNLVKIDSSRGAIEIKAIGALTIKAASITIEAAGKLDVKAGATLTLRGALVNIN